MEGIKRMKPFRIKFFLVALVASFTVSFPVYTGAQDSSLIYSVSFNEPELDDLLAPIALYPDPLLSQMLPASTYPAEVSDAAEWLKSGGNASIIDDQNWDDSVKAVARYPDVLNMMADNMDWTANLGDAFLNQPDDVSKSIQRLRWQARDMGNLASNDRQDVNIEESNIEIIPSQPQYFYVPIYDPVVVYVRRHEPSSVPFILFGPPLLLGGWLIMDFDWGHHQVVYHGWNRPGWVNHARPYVHVKNVYVQGSRPLLHERWRHDSSHGDPARYLASRPSGPNIARHVLTGEIRGNHTVSPNPVGKMFVPGVNARAYSNRGRESRGTVNQLPAPPVPSVAGRPISSPPATREDRKSVV
jgi:hypothetical protein